MKKINLLAALMMGASSLLLLQSSSAGRAAVGGQDRTGSPIANGTCSACHAGGNFSPSATAVITNSSGTAVTSYIPGQTYTVTFTVTGTGASGYAMQASMLNSTAMNAGDFLSATTANTQISTANGVEYMEHQGTQTTGTFIATWEAPAMSTGTVTLYGVGLAVDRNGSTGGDQVTPAIQVTLTEDNTTTVSTIRNDAQIALFDVYPMPNHGNFTVRNNGKETVSMVQLVNMAGQVVAAKQVTLTANSSQAMNFPNLIPGVYTVILEGENLRQAQQIVVNK